MLHIFHHFESMCIGMFEFIYGQHIHIYISNCRSALQHSPLQATSPRTIFFQCCEMSKMKGRKTKTPYGLNPPTRKLTFFWYPSGSIHFLKKILQPTKNVWCVQPTPFHHQNHKHFEKKKNNKRVFFHQTKKTGFFLLHLYFVQHRQNAAKPTKSCKVGDKIVNPDGHPYEILERLGHGTFGQARQGAMGVEDMWDRWG